MPHQELAAVIRQILAEHTVIPDNKDAPLALDSLAIVTVIEAVEEVTEIRVRALDVTPDAFHSLTTIVEFFSRYQRP